MISQSAGQELLQRLAGIQKALIGIYESGAGLSTATRGQEREHFIDLFLSKVLPPGYRFGTGDAIDKFGCISGQLDVVVEFTFFPSLPGLIGVPRLYLADGIAAVIEVKSDLAKQWKEVKATSTKLRPLRRVFDSPGFTPYGPPPEKIPIFAVGYTGWKTMETVRRKVNDDVVDGILIIDKGLFSTRSDFFKGMWEQRKIMRPGGLWAQGLFGLWGLVCFLHFCALSIVVNSASPIDYIERFINK